MSIDIDHKSAKLVDGLADLLLDVVTNGKVVEIVDRQTGEVETARVTPDAAMLNVVRQFVKDFPPLNTPTAGEPRGMLKEFSKRLPFSPGQMYDDQMAKIFSNAKDN